MNRREWKRAHGSVTGQVVKQSVQVMWRLVRNLLPQSIWKLFRSPALAKSTERPPQQSEGIHEEVGVADASHILEDTDITVSDVIVQEDGPYNAEPIYLPTDHEHHKFEDGVPCIEHEPANDDYLTIPSLTKSTILDPSTIIPIDEDHVKEGGDHTNAGTEVAWKCAIFEKRKGKQEVKAISRKHDQGKSVEPKIALPESTCA